MMLNSAKWVLQLVTVLMLWSGCTNNETTRSAPPKRPVPVVVSPIKRGAIDSVRVFSGSLEASQTITVSSKIGGRIESVLADIGDEVTSGQVVARVDDAEYKQALEQAKADLLVCKANVLEAKSTLKLSQRILERTQSLTEKGVSSEAELESAQSEWVTKEAQVEVYKAQLIRAKATLKKNQIQLAYAVVRAEWNDKTTKRVVAERFIDEGTVVSENTPLLRIVALSPIKAVFFVPENVYGALGVGQKVSVTTDAYLGVEHEGFVQRIAPVFQHSTRQARVEVEIENSDQKLKPGMFARIKVKVDSADNAVIVPGEAIVTRSDAQGVFVIAADTGVVRWRRVTLGIRHGSNVEVFGENLEGSVVTLGQQLLEDGSRVNVTTTEDRKTN